MDLNQAEVAVTTQHLIDIRQEKDNWLQMSDFGDMGEFLDVYKRQSQDCQGHGTAHHLPVSYQEFLTSKIQ